MSSKVFSFRVAAAHAPAVERAAQVRGLTPADFIRRAVMKQVRIALMEQAASEAPTRRRGEHHPHRRLLES